MIPLRGDEVDTLVGLIESGPLYDGDIPSKAGRDSLIDRRLAVRVVVKGQDGYTAATSQGRRAYCERYGADTIKEATANRIAARVIRKAGAK